MKIDAESINHNIIVLISAMNLSDLASSNEVTLEECKYWLGYINGIITLGENLKIVSNF